VALVEWTAATVLLVRQISGKKKERLYLRFDFFFNELKKKDFRMPLGQHLFQRKINCFSSSSSSF
jgi:hypothetical protein